MSASCFTTREDKPPSGLPVDSGGGDFACPVPAFTDTGYAVLGLVGTAVPGVGLGLVPLDLVLRGTCIYPVLVFAGIGQGIAVEEECFGLAADHALFAYGLITCLDPESIKVVLNREVFPNPESISVQAYLVSADSKGVYGTTAAIRSG